MKGLDMEFISEFEYYLKTEKKQKQITLNKAIQRFKKVVRATVEVKMIDSFLEHKPKSVKNQIIFLTVEELAKLENHQFSQITLQQIIFRFYTGLAYT